jgi:hypothetical protein
MGLIKRLVLSIGLLITLALGAVGAVIAYFWWEDKLY